MCEIHCQREYYVRGVFIVWSASSGIASPSADPSLSQGWKPKRKLTGYKDCFRRWIKVLSANRFCGFNVRKALKKMVKFYENFLNQGRGGGSGFLGLCVLFW